MRPADAVTERRRLGAAPRALASLAALVVVGLLIAGCGGGGKSPNVASLGTSSTSSTTSTSSSSTASDGGGGGTALGAGGPSNASGAGQPHSGFAIQTGNPQNALKLSECMRANGVPNFPDPNGAGVIQGSGIDPNSAAFQKATQVCGKNLHGGRAPSPAQIARAEAAALSYSKCMRAHGVTDFPDPQFGSGGRVSIRINGKAGGSGSGLDPNSPIFQKAQSRCGSLLPGRPSTKIAP